ncbi:hypothetical protein WAI453_000492 [Rhynchosporium graminicola]|uniref:ZZ-type domain-containing protein n=1 Tax=Rhynchosporium graminicola TaxID=2792576 RepID=A0A1E1JR21_9HELO|nr:uncharacterized protein RCO7_01059 [Rhynchosporium commune]
MPRKMPLSNAFGSLSTQKNTPPSAERGPRSNTGNSSHTNTPVSAKGYDLLADRSIPFPYADSDSEGRRKRPSGQRVTSERSFLGSVSTPNSSKPAISPGPTTLVDLLVRSCDGCDGRITGVRHKCRIGADFYFCTECYRYVTINHSRHEFALIQSGQIDIDENISELANLDTGTRQHSHSSRGARCAQQNQNN